MRIDGKADGSPVTEADLAADRDHRRGSGAARSRMSRRCPRSASHLAEPPYDGSFFLIDPLDGTKEFVAGRDEFTVNLALVTTARRCSASSARRRSGLIWRGVVGRGAERLTIGRRRRRPAQPIRSIPANACRAASPGSPRSAARMATAAPKPSSTSGPAPSGRCWARRSNSAGWRRARPISIPGSRRPANGISRPATPSSPRPAAGSPIADGSALRFGGGREGFIVPEFIAWGDPARRD